MITDGNPFLTAAMLTGNASDTDQDTDTWRGYGNQEHRLPDEDAATTPWTADYSSD